MFLLCFLYIYYTTKAYKSQENVDEFGWRGDGKRRERWLKNKKNIRKVIIYINYKGENKMVDKIIDDINKSLDVEAYWAALALVLTLPDICAKAEYQNRYGNRERYVKWYDEHIGYSEKPSYETKNDIEMPYLSGEVIYQLRCAVLHEGSATIKKDKIEEERCKITKFVILVEKEKEFNVYSDVHKYENENGEENKEIYVSIRRLCMIITRVAKNYYNSNKEKFDFSQCEIIDVDEEVKKLNKKHEKIRRIPLF